MFTLRRSLIVIVALTGLVLAGCSTTGEAADVQVLTDSDTLGNVALEDAAQVGAEEAPAEEALLEEAESALEFKSDDSGSGAALAPPASEVIELDEVSAELSRSEASDEAFATGESIASAPVQQVLELQAGEIDDNAEWDNYLLYRRDFLQDSFYPVHDVDVTGRHTIEVSTPQGTPVLGALVQIYDRQKLISETRTYANGQTLFFPNASRDGLGVDTFQAVVEKDGEVREFDLNRNETNEWHVTLEGVNTQRGTQLDVLFLIDATGSMADEIEQLQSNILSISQQVDALPGNPDTRYGMVTYRDRGDEYVTRVFDFTPDVGEFQSDLSRVRADGGGDTPESLNEALHDAVSRPEWRVDDTVSLVFLVADAAPHLDYGNDYDYAVEMVQAAKRGIKIHPIASSGLDPQGEFIFRQIGQYTMGHFVFLTYAGEQGGFDRPDLEAGGQDYTVDSLDDLVLRLITDELAALNAQ